MNIIINKISGKRIDSLITHGDYANIANALGENNHTMRVKIARAIKNKKGDTVIVTGIIRYYNTKQRKSKKLNIIPRAKSSASKKTTPKRTATIGNAPAKMGAAGSAKRHSKNKQVI